MFSCWDAKLLQLDQLDHDCTHVNYSLAFSGYLSDVYRALRLGVPKEMKSQKIKEAFIKDTAEQLMNQFEILYTKIWITYTNLDFTSTLKPSIPI